MCETVSAFHLEFVGKPLIADRSTVATIKLSGVFCNSEKSTTLATGKLHLSVLDVLHTTKEGQACSAVLSSYLTNIIWISINILINIYIYVLNGKNSEDPMCTTGPLPDTHASSRITSPHMSMILSVSNKNDLRQNCVMTTCFWTIINVTKWYLPIEAWNKRKEDPLKIIQCTLPSDTVVGSKKQPTLKTSSVSSICKWPYIAVSETNVDKECSLQ